MISNATIQAAKAAAARHAPRATTTQRVAGGLLLVVVLAFLALLAGATVGLFLRIVRLVAGG